MPADLTPVETFGGWIAKREDHACRSGPEYPSGSKVRQYRAMAVAQPRTPMLVGCSSVSAMQIYVAAAARQAGVPGIIYTAARAERSAATRYAIAMGAEVVEVRPGYLSVCRARAKERGKALGGAVRWNVAAALEDAAAQCANIPRDAIRVVVPTGSGLIASAVMVGLARTLRRIQVVAVAVSPMATEAKILATARKVCRYPMPPFRLIAPASDYSKWTAARLPDGTPLDPFYAAKALAHVRPGDCFWIPGCRPLAAMPAKCREALS